MYGLIGYPLGHSFSADFFNSKFKNENLDEVYQLFPLTEISEINRLLALNPGLKGLNVTIPYKEQVLPYLTDISDEAAQIGAVNVIKIFHEGDETKLIGYNTDVIGFKESLAPLLTANMRRALVLGSGGASHAVRYALEKMGISATTVSRHPCDNKISYSDITPDIMSEHRLIVNTTPLGMWPNVDKCPPIPYSCLSELHLCFDLVYNPHETLFMRKAAENGAKVKNGLEMLHRQALAAWDIWTL